MVIYNCFLALLIIVGWAHCSKRIVGLERISRLKLPGEDPYEGLKFLTNHRDVCTGILMSPTEVLTTCECVLDNNDYDLFAPRRPRRTESLRSLIEPTDIRVRTNDLGHPDFERLKVSEIRIHPKCDGKGSYDLGMLRLSSPVSNSADWFNDSFPFGPDWNGRWNDVDDTGNSSCHLASFLTNAIVHGHPLWVKQVHDDITDIPVKIVSMEYCDRFLSFGGRQQDGFDLSSKICVEAEEKPVPICRADIGSPLICNEIEGVKSPRLIGMTSLGQVQCNPTTHDAVVVVTPLDRDSWNFIYDFMGIGYKEWLAYLLKKSIRRLKEIIRFH